jgi:hypothetical protein
MKVARVPRLLAPALLMLAVACGDTAGADPLKRVYVLSTAAGRPLPLSVEQSFPDGTRRVHTVLSDTLLFVSDSILHRRREELFSHVTPGNLALGSSQRVEKTGRYRRRGEVLFITWLDQGRDTLWVRSGTLVAAENVGSVCTSCQPLVQTVEFVYR